MEDVQPNEFRMSRKGSTRVPTVRSSHRVTSWRGYRGRGQSRRSSEDNSARGSQPWHGPAPSRQCLTTKPPPPLPSRERHSYDRGSMYRAEIAPHFDQPPRRAEAGAVSVPPVSFQQDFSSLGEPRRSLKQPDIKPSSECHGGALGGSQLACEDWFSKKRAQLLERDHWSSVNSSQRDLTKDHSLRRAIHAPPHEVGRNNDFNETQTHPAVYSPPTIQPECCPPQTAKSVATHNPSDRGSSCVVDPGAIAPVNMSPLSWNLTYAVETDQLHEGRSYQIPCREGHQNSPSQGPAPSTSINPDEIIDLTQELSKSSAEKVRRWNAFRSGVLDVPLLLPAQTISNHFPTATASTSRLEAREDTMEMDLAEDNGGCCHYGQLDVVEPDRPTTLNAHDSSLPTSFGLLGENFRLPLELYDRFRRIVNINDFPPIIVTMHGFINRIREIGSSRPCQVLWSPGIPTQEHVDDACLLPSGHDTVSIILAHAREDAQLTFLSFKDNQVFGENVLRRDWKRAKKGGVSALATMLQPLKFASGGYDHQIHLWSMDDDLSHASSVQLTVRHTSMIHSLLPIRDTSHKLVSAGADRNVHLWDLCSERVARTLKTSNTPHNIHRTESPFCTLLEVAHLDLQFEVHDHRMVPRCPVHRFGFATQVPPGRYMKGDTWSHFFVSGDRDGRVRVWDLRNVSGEPYVCQCFENEVTQVVKTESHILACSKRSEYRLISIHDG
ncbi:hypothetical protein EV401DRAFT_1901582 [Pisolithus croceorrhizus]|nr:hypothetical protein EV401DRAFT_1901582 [Pisolithus croceorrhizus]